MSEQTQNQETAQQLAEEENHIIAERRAKLAALREAGAEVLGVASIFTYGMKKGVERMAEAGVKNVSLTNLDTIAQVGAEEGYIAPEDVSRLLKFRDNPSDESWINGGKN